MSRTPSLTRRTSPCVWPPRPPRTERRPSGLSGASGAAVVLAGAPWVPGASGVRQGPAPEHDQRGHQHQHDPGVGHELDDQSRPVLVAHQRQPGGKGQDVPDRRHDGDHRGPAAGSPSQALAPGGGPRRRIVGGPRGPGGVSTRLGYPRHSRPKTTPRGCLGTVPEATRCRRSAHARPTAVVMSLPVEPPRE
jgi:hypothetical protein